MPKKYIDREKLLTHLTETKEGLKTPAWEWLIDVLLECYKTFPAADVVEVVRCQDCIHAIPLERNCELNSTIYMHCYLWRGEPVENVWHKYKKYYRDYSVVDRKDFCSYGERRTNDD